MEIDLDGFCINEDSLKRLCVACPSLEEVKLPNHYHFSEASVWVLLRHLPALRTLELNSSDRVTGRCFSLLPSSLQRLSVAGCSGLRSDSLRQVGARCPQLRQLDVSGVPEVHAGDLAAALVGCPQLERLTARRLLEPVERYLPPAGLQTLRHLDVALAAGVTDTTLRQLPDLLPGLHTLNIQGTSLTELQRATLAQSDINQSFSFFLVVVVVVVGVPPATRQRGVGSTRQRGVASLLWADLAAAARAATTSFPRTSSGSGCMVRFCRIRVYISAGHLSSRRSGRSGSSRHMAHRAAGHPGLEQPRHSTVGWRPILCSVQVGPGAGPVPRPELVDVYRPRPI